MSGAFRRNGAGRMASLSEVIGEEWDELGNRTSTPTVGFDYDAVEESFAELKGIMPANPRHWDVLHVMLHMTGTRAPWTLLAGLRLAVGLDDSGRRLAERWGTSHEAIYRAERIWRKWLGLPHRPRKKGDATNDAAPEYEPDCNSAPDVKVCDEEDGDE